MTSSEPKHDDGSDEALDEAPGVASEADHELRTFGRTRSRSLTARQQDVVARLSSQTSIDLSTDGPLSRAGIFDQAYEALWLEIGFGGGEHLLWQARENPNVGIIGCEPFRDGVVRVLTAIDEEHLGNIRLHVDDARPLLRRLQPQSIDRAFILFPDPWPKKRHNKRRLINANLAESLAKIMKSGAQLRIATDIDDYLKSILLTFHGHPDFDWLAARPSDWRVRPSDWPATRYEAKAIREGRSCAYLRFRRT
ncbi:MAG: tRNA (guanosine(46)-N7)-methyltransferase TrmB [Pseudomonadota bacterium]